MKKTRRFASLATAAILAACAVVPATMSALPVSAADYTITVKNSTQDADHTYGAYQIFTGDLSESTLSNIEWGTGVKSTDLLAKLEKSTIATTDGSTLGEKITALGENPTAIAVAEVLAKIEDNSANAEAMAKLFDGCLTTTKTELAKGASGEDGTTYTASVPSGYYLIRDDKAVTGQDSATKFILQVVKDVEVSPKSDTPTLTKEIKHNESDAWGVVGDNQIGDTVNYRITTTMPDPAYVKYFGTAGDTYSYVIHDKMTEGLDFDKNTVKITLGGKAVDAKFYTVSDSCGHTFTTNLKTGQNAGESFDIEFDMDGILADATLGAVATKGAQFVVTYDCTLTTAALVASSADDDNNSNDNTTYLEFSNNPYDTKDTGKTPEVTVYDWTFTYDVTKYANSVADENKLAGAGFTIYDGATELKFSKPDTSKEEYVVDPNGTITEIKTTDSGTFRLKGLDDETTYTMKETTVPDKYNKCADITFKISDTYNGTPEGKELATLTAENKQGETTLSAGNAVNVINKSGSTLPSTGGIGTTIFYVAGGVLVVGAGVLLITKKRAKDAQ